MYLLRHVLRCKVVHFQLNPKAHLDNSFRQSLMTLPFAFDNGISPYGVIQGGNVEFFADLHSVAGLTHVPLNFMLPTQRSVDPGASSISE